jgi:hypothetical protein
MLQNTKLHFPPERRVFRALRSVHESSQASHLTQKVLIYNNIDDAKSHQALPNRKRFRRNPGSGTAVAFSAQIARSLPSRLVVGSVSRLLPAGLTTV